MQSHYSTQQSLDYVSKLNTASVLFIFSEGKKSIKVF